ncbi:hypothetical protein T440DRAFT_505954 [Plenodomus tracheiphilus IPT5]|uniref:Glyoxalase-like domain-containing protein n=1 Tax=Plenodomus tracheiphilus IPT5 TaxID=1408161 RepID=A0A6A7BCH8_9PLEO|nr:hypothetical protein T440DRAFT_505954 [Plenodomus tracheiphilus IPT5]
MSPSRQSLDHLILFLPVDPATKLPDCPQYFKENFTLTPGGFHADGATSNTLILLADGCYIELISFVNTDLAHAHWWGPDADFVGWKDWCLTNGESPDDNYNNIAGTHEQPIQGGRKRANGVDVKWAVTFPQGEKGGQEVRGRIPFFCHDITPRNVRVPLEDTKTAHPSGALGVRQLTVIVKDQAILDETKRAYASILGTKEMGAEKEVSIKVGRVQQVDELDGGPEITLRLPANQDETKRVEDKGFVYGNVVLGAKASSERPQGSSFRLDSATGAMNVSSGHRIEHFKHSSFVSSSGSRFQVLTQKPFPFTMKAILAVSTLIALAATGLYHIRQISIAIQDVPTSQIISTASVPESLDQGSAIAIVNPNKHIPVHDSRHINVQLLNTMNNEEILARFVKGFFGGHVFAPERSILRAVRQEISRFDALKDIPVSSHVWSTSQLSNQTLSPLHALLFGAFRVVDSKLSEAESYIDFAFGSDSGGLVGVHRFSVSEDSQVPETPLAGMRSVRIEFAHSGCNPKENKPLGPEVLQTLHLWYAMLLFREGVAEVMKSS